MTSDRRSFLKGLLALPLLGFASKVTAEEEMQPPADPLLRHPNELDQVRWYTDHDVHVDVHRKVFFDSVPDEGYYCETSRPGYWVTRDVDTYESFGDRYTEALRKAMNNSKRAKGEYIRETIPMGYSVKING